jgi:hypothetical protein
MYSQEDLKKITDSIIYNFYNTVLTIEEVVELSIKENTK